MKRVLKNIGLYLLIGILRILVVIEFIAFIFGFIPGLLLEGIIRMLIAIVGIPVWIVSGNTALFDIAFDDSRDIAVTRIFDFTTGVMYECIDELTSKIN